jgi:AraC family transcriptional regulator of arabinose operon
MGVNTPHTNKFHFVRNETLGNADMRGYLLMYFKTPFLYKDGEAMKKCEKDSYLLFSPESKAEHASADEGFINDWIFFEGNEAERIIEELEIPVGEPFEISSVSIIEPYVNKISEELKFKHKSYENQISALVTEMLVELGRALENSRKISHAAYDAMTRARSYMLNHVAEKISTDDLAKYSNYSVSRFCFLYNFFFGASPMDDLINARIEKAINLLKYQNVTIGEAAELCGFSSIHYFSRKFKEKVGVSPSYYLKKSQAPSR